MTKREIEQSDAAAAAEGSRPKRRKEGAGAPSDADVDMAVTVSNETETIGQGEAEIAKEQGLRLWHIVKEAVNKEGRTLSVEFLKRPPKRLYPDYYQIIQKPIALEDIKKQLDNNAYQSLEVVRADFELCFTNAKTYNMKESEIWKDAKDLLKLVNKTYEKMVPPMADVENADGGTGDKGKSKTPSMYRMIKSRLQKLIEKADDTGRILSTEFMELPSKKEWPIYYKEIKRPQCLENIFKHIKRKEYPSVAEFATDVELVFSNALTFNQEHTLIWEDARVLRDYFRQLMSDLPTPFSLPEYSKPTPTRIKIKPQVTAPAEGQTSASPNITLRVPALVSPVAKTSTQAATTSNTSTSASLAQTVVPTSQTATTVHKQAQLPPTTPQAAIQSTQAASQATTSYAHYPNALYHTPTAAAPTPSASIAQGTPNIAQSQSPTPSATSGHQLKYIFLRVQPNNRKICLDYQDGVKSWVMRLSPTETGVLVGEVTFFHDEEEESSAEEEAEQEPKQEEEEYNIEEVSTKNGRRKGKSRAKTRAQKAQAKSAASKPKALAVKKKVVKIGEVQVKLNGSIIKEEEKDGKWTVNLPVGSHVLEIGEAGGILWKVYAERLAA
ncbi:hypothetical protein AX15_005497 [Amanita polypyramis BW_CC]|nr:hypothetical protein AX15_005497 [Amanita polypyramis BW_CC]